MKTTRLGILGGLIALAGFVPATSETQEPRRIIFTPYAGVYVPSNDVIGISESGGGMTLTGYAKHRTSPAFGLNASYWLTDRAAIEVGGLYAMSDVRGETVETEGSDVFTESLSENAHVWIGSAKFLIHLLPAQSKFNVRLGLGPAVINRGGTAYKSDEGEEVTGLTDFGAAMSLCTRIPLTSNAGIRLRAENFLYQTKLGLKDAVGVGDLKFKAKTQNDLVFSAGLQLFFNR
jgi:hypothetical protein